MTEVNTLLVCNIEVWHVMFDCLKMDLSQAYAGLCTFDSEKRNIKAAGDRGIYELNNKITVVASHCLSKS